MPPGPTPTPTPGGNGGIGAGTVFLILGILLIVLGIAYLVYRRYKEKKLIEGISEADMKAGLNPGTLSRQGY